MESTQNKPKPLNISFQTQAIVLVFILSALAGLLGSPSILVIALALMGAVLVFLIPSLGLIALLLAALVVPFQINTGTQTPIHAVLLLIPILFGAWLARMFWYGDITIVPSRVNLPLSAFCVVAILAFIVGNLPWNYFAEPVSLVAQLAGLSIFLFSVIAFFLTANLIKDLRWLQALVWVFSGLGAIYVIGALIPTAGAIAAGWIQESATGSVFWICLVAFAWAQCLFNSRLNWVARLACGALALASLAMLWLQARSWASGWVPSMIAMGVIFWLRFPRAGMLLVAAGVTIFIVRISSILSIVSADAQGTLFPLYARIAAWQTVLEATMPNWLLGLGPSNYYSYDELYPILGYYVRFSSHNNYIDLVAQVGILGLAAFLWFIVAYTREAWSLRKRTDDGFARSYVNACLGALVATLAAGMLGDWFLPFVYNIGLKGFRASVLGWLFLGGLIAIKGFVESKPASLLPESN